MTNPEAKSLIKKSAFSSVMTQLKIFDTLLRDGCQSAEVNFSIRDKIELVKHMDSFGVDYIELGWPAANKKEMETFREAAKLSLKTSSIVAFGSTRKKDIPAAEDRNLQGIVESKATVACIFGKTWIDHIEKQLSTTPEKNLEAIRESITFLRSKGLEVLYDLEHFFDGYKDNKKYALRCIEAAASAGASHVIPCDTNGGTLPGEVKEILREVFAFIRAKEFDVKVGVHFHNDSGLGVANSLIGAEEGVSMIQGTINGLGERAGNADLCQIIPNLLLKMDLDLPNIQLENVSALSKKVDTLANMKEDHKKPFVGKHAFSHKGGIHVDAINKGASYEHINPITVGNKRDVVLSDLSGKANVLEVLKKFGVTIEKHDPKVEEMLSLVEEMEKHGYDMGALPAEQFLLKEKVHKTPMPLQIKSWEIRSEEGDEEYAECSIKAKVRGQEKASSSRVSGGPVDAAFQAMNELVSTSKEIEISNFKVVIVKDHAEKSAVRVYVEFSENAHVFGTVGISTNILKASIEAIEKGFNYWLLTRNQ